MCVEVLFDCGWLRLNVYQYQNMEAKSNVLELCFMLWVVPWFFYPFSFSTEYLWILIKFNVIVDREEKCDKVGGKWLKR